MTFLFKIEEKR